MRALLMSLLLCLPAASAGAAPAGLPALPLEAPAALDGADETRLAELDALLAEGQAGAAADGFEVLASRLGDPALWARAAGAALRAERLVQAERSARAGLALAPEDPQLAGLLGVALLGRGASEEARTWLGQGERSPGLAPFLKLYRSQAELALGRPARAASLAGEVLDSPRRPPQLAASAWLGIAHARLLLGQTVEAERAYRKSLELMPADDACLAARVHGSLGELARLRGELGDAREELQRALVTHAGGLCATGLRADLLRAMGGVEAAAGAQQEARVRFDEALEHYRALGLERGRAEVLVEQARAAIGVGSYGDALAALEEARSVHQTLALPLEAAAVEELAASAWSGLSELAEALSAVTRALALYAGSEAALAEAGALLTRSGLLVRAGELSAAAADLERADRLLGDGPNEALAARRRAAELRLAGAQGRAGPLRSRARRESRRLSAVGLPAEAIALLADLAADALDRGRPAVAAEFYAEALELADDLGATAARAVLARNQARVLLQLGDTEGALALDPTLDQEIDRAESESRFRAALQAADRGDYRGGAEGLEALLDDPLAGEEAAARASSLRLLLARQALAAGADGEAAEELGRAEELARRSGRDGLLVDALLLSAERLRRLGQDAPARSRLDEAIERSADDPAREADARVARATLARQVGEDGIADLERVLSISAPVSYSRAAALRLMALAALEDGDPSTGCVYLTEAQGLLQRLERASEAAALDPLRAGRCSS